MGKEVLFLCGEYCPNMNSLKEMVRSRCREEEFRGELLTFYYDKVLQRWLEEREFHIDYDGLSNNSDIEWFKSFYHAVVGEPCKVNLECDFFKYVELERAEVDEKTYPMRFGSSIWADGGKQISFVFKPKKLGNESFELVIKSENNEIMQLLPFHPESIYQEFSVSFPLEGISKNEMLELFVRKNCVDTPLCAIYLGCIIKLRHRNNPLCYLELYKLKCHKCYMTEVINKDAGQLNRIFGDDYIKKLEELYKGLPWDMWGFNSSEVVMMLEDYIHRCYLKQFQYPEDEEILDFLDVFPKYVTYTFTRSRAKGDYSLQDSKDTKAVTCFSIAEEDLRHAKEEGYLFI